MTRYRKKPTEVEAFQLGDDHRALAEFLADTRWHVIPLAGSIVVSTPVGDMTVRPGQWIVRDDAGYRDRDAQRRQGGAG